LAHSLSVDRPGALFRRGLPGGIARGYRRRPPRIPGGRRDAVPLLRLARRGGDGGIWPRGAAPGALAGGRRRALRHVEVIALEVGRAAAAVLENAVRVH